MDGDRQVAASTPVTGPTGAAPLSRQSPLTKQPLRGILAIGASTPTELKDKLDEAFRKVEGGWTPRRQAPCRCRRHARPNGW